jgi:hypothetical protein
VASWNSAVERSLAGWSPSWRSRSVSAYGLIGLKPLEMELAAAAMSDAEWALFVRRSRGGR